MKEKYITEKFPRWFIFGEGGLTGEKDLVDVSSEKRDIATGMKRAEANAMIEEHNRAIDALVDAMMKAAND